MDPTFSASRDRQRGLAEARDSLLVCAPPPTTQTSSAGRMGRRGCHPRRAEAPGSHLRLYEWTRAGDPAGHSLRGLSGISSARGWGLLLPRTTSTPSSDPAPLTANPLTPHLPGRPHTCREAPARKGRGFSQISRQMVGGLGPWPGPALNAASSRKPPQPADMEGAGGPPQATSAGPCPPAPRSLLRLHATPTDVNSTWEGPASLPGGYTSSGQARRRAPQGLTDKDKDWPPPPRPGAGPGGPRGSLSEP